MNIDEVNYTKMNSFKNDPQSQSNTLPKTFNEIENYPDEYYQKIINDINNSKNKSSLKDSNQYKNKMKERENERYQVNMGYMSSNNFSLTDRNNIFTKQNYVDQNFKTLHINIKDMARQILFEEKEKKENFEHSRSYSVKKINNCKIENMDKSQDKSYNKPNDNFHNFNQKVENILSDSFDLNNINNLKNRSFIDIRKSPQTENSKENSFLTLPTPKINLLKKSGNESTISNRSLSNPHKSQYHFPKFDFSNIQKSQIKFSYLWDLIDIFDKRKLMLADKELEDIVNKNDIKNITLSKSKSTNKLFFEPPRKMTEHKIQHNKKTSDNFVKIYGKLKEARSNYLTNHFINKKNKILQDILGSPMSSKQGDKIYKKGMEWLDIKNQNKIRLEQKFKEEMKITDENERFLKGFPNSEIIREETEDSRLNESILNNSELLRELTENIIKNQNNVNPYTRELTFSNYKIDKEIEDDNYNNCDSSKDEDLSKINSSRSNIFSHKDLMISKMSPINYSHVKINSLNKEKTYDQRLRELIKSNRNNIDKVDFVKKTKDILEKHKSSNDVSIYDINNIK